MRKHVMPLVMPLGLISILSLPALSVPAMAAEPSAEQRFQQLDTRIQALEAEAQRLREQAAAALEQAQVARTELEQMKAAQAAAPTAQVDASVAAVSSSGESGAAGGSGNPNAFNPAISIILNGQYAHHSVSPDDYVRSGFPLVGEGQPLTQGLSIGESELSFAANIDDKFYGQLTLALNSDTDGSIDVGIEEAFIDTTTLPAGFTLRAGRFFSNIGYLNSHHAHTDNFTDRPLAYQAFLGNQYGDDGVQVRWVAPTDVFLELGGEVFRGDEFPAGGAAHGGVGAHTLFAHAGGDVGVESSWLAGISYLRSAAHPAEDGFDGEDSLYVADFTWKWAPNGNTKDGGLTLRSEYLRDDRDGDFMADSMTPVVERWLGKRSGIYVEGVYRINRTWDTGYRYDKLWAADEGPLASAFDPTRHTVMLTWRNSEFSLVRLEYSHDESSVGQTDNVASLQYQVSLGAHGAHKF
ncbi:MAG TPA: hypothetical protein VGN07_19600 [Steroidobacteraceae bacterium]|jgi:hypothetical protein